MNMNNNEIISNKEIERLRAEFEQLKQEHDREVANLTQIARAAITAKRGFLTNMSHELRTPLTAIIGFSELLSDQHFGKLNERQYTYAREIFNAGHHLLALIKDILDLAKTESGSQVVEPSNVNLTQLLSNSLSMVKERAIKHCQKLELELEDSLKGIVIRADELKLKQIMFNLLTNAVKFTPDGGQVRVIARKLDSRISVSVCDSGIGIRTEDLERIFDMFEQVDTSYSRQIQGTGLGLALARRLVELHGGEISAYSQGVGRGSILSFSIPLILVEPEWNESSSLDMLDQIDVMTEIPTGLPDQNGLRLVALVIEDNSSNLKLLVDLLEREGYRSLKASSAEEALDIAENAQPDVILMDISLPGMDGLEATRRLKQNHKTCHIPVIAVTANAFKIDETRAVEAGCEAYLSKPINPKSFVSILNNLKNHNSSAS